MHGILFALMSSAGGVCIIAALDSTMIFFLPLAVDIGVILITSRHRDLFWLYPVVVSLSSLVGAAATFYLGRRMGEAGLERFVSARRLKWVKSRLQRKGAVAMAAFDMIPPPFPFTAVILTAAALDANVVRFFLAMFGFRLIRFGSEAALAAIYGRQIVRWMESDLFHDVAYFFTVLVIGGTIVSVIQFIRKTRHSNTTRRSKQAA
jgi:membrane protein YqaA with SNARE-associated domain